MMNNDSSSAAANGNGTVDDDDTMMREVTNAMDNIQLPDDGAAAPAAPYNQGTNQQQEGAPGVAANMLQTPNAESHRPLDTVAQAGPPVPPIPFEQPQFGRGRRDDVLVYLAQTREHKIFKNVLFRDSSRDYHGGRHHNKGDDEIGLEAYWKVPHKQQISTIMGHVEICLVLTRCIQDQSDGESSNSSDSSNDQEEEEDIVFQVTNEYVAVKVNYAARMEQLRDRHAEDPMKEIAAMQLIGNNHPHVMGTKDVLFDGSNLNVVMPYCDSGDLFELLQESQQKGAPLPEGEARFWFRQMLKGMEFLLRTVGLCHRDLSPENVLIDENKCLIIDMGMAIRIPFNDDVVDPQQAEHRQNNSHPVSSNRRQGGGTRQQRRLIEPQGACGKLPYMSPEIYKSRSPFDGEAVDIWTAGTILFCMVTGNRSYQRPHDSDPQYYWMTHGLERLVTDWGVTLSPELLHLLQHILQVDPRLRLTLDEILNHPWMNQPDTTPPSRR